MVRILGIDKSKKNKGKKKLSSSALTPNEIRDNHPLYQYALDEFAHAVPPGSSNDDGGSLLRPIHEGNDNNNNNDDSNNDISSTNSPNDDNNNNNNNTTDNNIVRIMPSASWTTIDTASPSVASSPPLHPNRQQQQQQQQKTTNNIAVNNNNNNNININKSNSSITTNATTTTTGDNRIISGNNSNSTNNTPHQQQQQQSGSSSMRSMSSTYQQQQQQQFQQQIQQQQQQIQQHYNTSTTTHHRRNFTNASSSFRMIPTDSTSSSTLPFAAVYEEQYGVAYTGGPIKYVYPIGYQTMRPRSCPWKLSIFICIVFTWLSIFIVGHCSDQINYDEAIALESIDDDSLVIDIRWCGSRPLYATWVASMLITGLSSAYCALIGYIKVRDFAVANSRSQPPVIDGKSDYYVKITDDNTNNSNSGSGSGSLLYKQTIYQSDGNPQFWGSHIYRPTQAAVAVTSR